MWRNRRLAWTEGRQGAGRAAFAAFGRMPDHLFRSCYARSGHAWGAGGGSHPRFWLCGDLRHLANDGRPRPSLRASPGRTFWLPIRVPRDTMRAGGIRQVKHIFEDYLLKLREAYTEEGTEHSGRTALENFLSAVAATIAPNAHVQHEPKRQKDKGAPDFMVRQSGMILGYVENKPIDTDLNKVLKSDQIKKYRASAVTCCSPTTSILFGSAAMTSSETASRSRPTWRTQDSFRAKTGCKRSRRFSKASFRLRRRVLAGRNSLRLRSPPAASFCVTSSARS